MSDDVNKRLDAALAALDECRAAMVPGARYEPVFRSTEAAMRASVEAVHAVLKEIRDAR